MDEFNLNTLLLIFILAIVIFSPFVTRLQRKFFIKKSKHFKSLSVSEVELLINKIDEAVSTLSAKKIGALITIEKSESLDDFVKSGQIINSIVSAPLLESIFNKSSPLHDGSVIIQGDNLSCSSAYFPTSKQSVDTKYGARHRAALGLSEVRDAIVVTVSETDGSVHIVKKGKMYRVQLENFRAVILGHINNG